MSHWDEGESRLGRGGSADGASPLGGTPCADRAFSSRHGGRIHEFARASGRSVDTVRDFSASLNPLGPPASVLNLWDRSRSWLIHYPDSTQAAVRAVLAATTGVGAEHIWCGNGANEVLDHVVAAWKPPRTWILAPAYSEYARIARRHGSAVQHVDLTADFRLPLPTLRDQIRPHDLVILNNPHNPSGRAWPRTVWEEDCRLWTARGARVLVDEAFVDFLDDPWAYTALPLLDTGRVAVVRSATKIFTLPGLRFGFGLGPPELLRTVADIRDPWSVNQPAQETARVAYTDAHFLDRTHAWLHDAQRDLAATWGRHPAVHLYPTQVNYALVRLRDDDAGRRLVDGLRPEGILVRSFPEIPGWGHRFIRFALRRAEDNLRLWTAAEPWLG